MKSLKASIQESLIIESKELTIEVTFSDKTSDKEIQALAKKYNSTVINTEDEIHGDGIVAFISGNESDLKKLIKAEFDDTDLNDYVSESKDNEYEIGASYRLGKASGTGMKDYEAIKNSKYQGNLALNDGSFEIPSGSVVKILDIYKKGYHYEIKILSSTDKSLNDKICAGYLLPIDLGFATKL